MQSFVVLAWVESLCAGDVSTSGFAFKTATVVPLDAAFWAEDDLFVALRVGAVDVVVAGD